MRDYTSLPNSQESKHSLSIFVKKALFILLFFTISQSFCTNNVEAGCCKKLRNKIKKEVKRGKKKAKKAVKKAAKGAKKVVKDVVKAPVDVVQSAVNVGEAAVKAVEGDKEGAKKALERAENNLEQGSQRLGKSVGTIGEATIDLTVKAPLKFHLHLLDEVLQNNGKFSNEYGRVYGRTSKDIRKSSKSIGAALEVAVQPKNLGKIAFIYAASTVVTANFINVTFGSILKKLKHQAANW